MTEIDDNTDNSVYTMREINLESCAFTKPEKIGNYHGSYITLNGSKGFVLQSPKLILRNSTDSYVELLISRNKDRHKEFYNIISHLEDSAILQITQNSEQWFGRNMKRDIVEPMFRSSINRPLEIDDPYILRINKTDKLETETNYPVVCLIKIEGILFGKNSSCLHMKVVQIKVIKTEKLQSDEHFEHFEQVPNDKPFYNDNASVIPNNYNVQNTEVQSTEAQSTESNVENQLEENQKQLEEIIDSEKIIDKFIENSEVPEVPDHIISDQISEAVQHSDQHTVLTDAMKYEIMKAMVENNFQRVKELSSILN